MNEDLLPSVPGRRHIHVTASFQTGACVSLTAETVLVLDVEAGTKEATLRVRSAMQEMLEAFPLDEIDRIERKLGGSEDPVVREPHPAFIKLLQQIGELNKTLKQQAHNRETNDAQQG